MKKDVLEEVLAKLDFELEGLIRSARAAHEAATHEESKPEDQYDTRGLEASYLAGAQAKRAADLQAVIAAIRRMQEGLERSGPRTKTGIGALAEVESNGRRSWYLLLPDGAGISVEAGGRTIQLITPRSPLGEALLDREPGDDFEVETQAGVKEYRLLRVE